MFIPSTQAEKKAFSDAMKKAVEECVGKKIFMARNDNTENVEIKRYPDPDKVKQDGIVLEFIKDFYELISGEKVLRPTDPVIKNIKYSVIKDLLFIKSGEIITEKTQTGKYWTNYRTEAFTDKKTNELETGIVKDKMAVYFSGVDDTKLMTNPDYFKQFEKIVLSSHILEALSAINQRMLPVFAYGGEVSVDSKQMVENMKVEKYMNKMNEAILLPRSRNSGDYR